MSRSRTTRTCSSPPSRRRSPSTARSGSLLATEPARDPEALVREAVRANVRVSVNQLRHGSEILEHLIDHDGLVVVGAEYDLGTGVVAFL